MYTSKTEIFNYLYIYFFICIYSKEQKCSCKDFAICNYSLATIGDDYKVNIISLNTKQVHQIIGKL